MTWDEFYDVVHNYYEDEPSPRRPEFGLRSPLLLDVPQSSESSASSDSDSGSGSYDY